ncbi:hypothetical protein GGS20DRAFT_447038 [Poronia punctata]|nr:hypothetical protein GGS20DRAFT_447038 [Poronia punctata]
MGPTPANDIILYDVPTGPPGRPFAPNPWKTRFALNFKRAGFTTEWVDFVKIKEMRQRLGAEPVRFFPNGEPHYTVPVIKDTSTNTVVGDSFDIALHLEKKYPDAPSLFRGPVSLYAAFNSQIETVFYTAMALCSEGFPFNPETEAEGKAEMCRRHGVKSYDDLIIPAEARRNILDTFKNTLGDVDKIFQFAAGPFIGGQEPDYADFILGAWLMFFNVTVPEFEEIRTWHDGRWGKLHDSLEPYRGTW